MTDPLRARDGAAGRYANGCCLNPACDGGRGQRIVIEGHALWVLRGTVATAHDLSVSTQARQGAAFAVADYLESRIEELDVQ